jgi:hypothetical protein
MKKTPIKPIKELNISKLPQVVQDVISSGHTSTGERKEYFHICQYFDDSENTFWMFFTAETNTEEPSSFSVIKTEKYSDDYLDSCQY